MYFMLIYYSTDITVISEIKIAFLLSYLLINIAFSSLAVLESFNVTQPVKKILLLLLLISSWSQWTALWTVRFTEDTSV